MTDVSQPRVVLVWRNGNWGQTPRRDFFVSNLHAHIEKTMTNRNSRRTEKQAILAQIEEGKVVTVNGMQFRYKYDKSAHHEPVQEAA